MMTTRFAKKHYFFLSLMMVMSIGFSACRGITPVASHLSVASEQAIVEKLSQVAKDVAYLQRKVKKNDEARLYVMANHLAHAQELIKTNGIANLNTGSYLVKVVKQFLYAEIFFQFIRSENTSQAIDRILSLTIATNGDSLRKDIGFDNQEGSDLVDYLEVMKDGLASLIQSDEVPEDMKARMRPLVVNIGMTLGLAMAQRDRPMSFLATMDRCAEIDGIYDLLDQFTGTQQLFAYAQEIRGTNEYLKEYTQYELVRDRLGRDPTP